MTTQDEPARSPAEELIADLVADGVVDSEGRFTLAQERARQELAEFRFSDPDRYVLTLVQAAVARGATTIDFDIDSDDMRMRFDGEPLSEAELDQTLSTLELTSSDALAESRWLLSMALAAAEARQPRFIGIVSGDGEHGCAVVVRPGQPHQFHRLEAPVRETRVHVKSRLSAGQVMDAATKAFDGELPLERLLRKRCRYAKCTIRLEGQAIAFGPFLKTGVGRVPIATGAFQGEAGHRTESWDPSTIHLVRRGVWFDTLVGDFPGTGFEAVVSSPALREDLSQARVVRDEAVTQVLAAARVAQRDSLRLLARSVDVKGEPPGIPGAWFRSVMRRALGEIEDLEVLQGAPADSVERALAGVPLWRVVDAEGAGALRASVQEVRAFIAQGRRVCYFGLERGDLYGGGLRQPGVVKHCVNTGAVALRLREATDEAQLFRLFGDQVVPITGRRGPAAVNPGESLAPPDPEATRDLWQKARGYDTSNGHGRSQHSRGSTPEGRGLLQSGLILIGVMVLGALSVIWIQMCG